MQAQEPEFIPGKYSLLIDTDSCSVEIEPILIKLFGTVPTSYTNEQIDIACDYLDNVLTKALNDNCKKLSREAFLSENNFIEFKREKFAGMQHSNYFLANKSYSVYVLDSEGVRLSEWKHTGNVLRKSAAPLKLKEAMKNFIEKASLENWTQNKFNEYCYTLFEDFKHWNLSDFCKSCGYSTEKSFQSPFNTEGVTSSSAIAAGLHNDMVKYCKIEHKIPKIRVGDKFRIVYVKPNNKFGIEYIGFQFTLPEEFKEYLEVDYNICFEKYFLKPIEPYIKTLKFRIPDMQKQSVFNLDDL